MLHTRRGLAGAATAPHHLAAEAGAEVLRDGGDAVEAMVAMAASIAVVYPHMNAIGGDAFWLIAEPGRDPIAIDGAGPAAGLATPALYDGREAIPPRGPLAALTTPGAVASWIEALDATAGWGARRPLSVLLADAVRRARDGVVVTRGQSAVTAEKLDQLAEVPGFRETFLSADGGVPPVGAVLKQPGLAATFERLAQAGLADFYRGDLARSLTQGLEAVGSPLRLGDFEAMRARRVAPLALDAYGGRLFNMTPPTQGVAALMILGLFERLKVSEAEGFAHIHGLVEATKQAFLLRNAHLADADAMTQDPRDWLAPEFLDARARRIDAARAAPWPQIAKPGDTIWMGCADAQGRVVSFIQSTFWEYGSGVVPTGTGVVFQNRGAGFTLDPAHPNCLAPGKRPFHTLIPAMARLKDGTVLSYGNMGGEGQPQSQAAVFTRTAVFGQSLQQAITAPRWLLGKTWGEETTSLKIESRADGAVIEALAAAGHEVEVVAPFTSMMGHAGAVAVRPDGVVEAAADPRSDGAAVVV